MFFVLIKFCQGTKSFQQYQYTTADENIETFSAARLDFEACNPFTQERIPVYVVDGMLPFPDGASSYMGVPVKNDIDSTFAKCLGLPIRKGSSKTDEVCLGLLCTCA